jgi:hypothetical protein
LRASIAKNLKIQLLHILAFNSKDESSMNRLPLAKFQKDESKEIQGLRG